MCGCKTPDSRQPYPLLNHEIYLRGTAAELHSGHPKTNGTAWAPSAYREGQQIRHIGFGWFIALAAARPAAKTMPT